MGWGICFDAFLRRLPVAIYRHTVVAADRVNARALRYEARRLATRRRARKVDASTLAPQQESCNDTPPKRRAATLQRDVHRTVFTAAVTASGGRTWTVPTAFRLRRVDPGTFARRPIELSA